MKSDTNFGTTTGIIGSRPLAAVQTFGIARLTSDPVALIPGTFVAVTGRGPKDSNESGKTSFLAATALLLGDPEWQITGNGTANATSLLFEPVIAGASAHLAGAAERGYIVGMFTDPRGERPHTVWLQISNDKPHVQVRHRPGIHLLTEGTDEERHKAAPEFYKKLGGDPLGSSEYAHRLYGRAPKVLAYVASRGQVRSRPSLLKLEAAAYTPDRIGEALIALSGRSGLLEHDRQQRQDLAQKQREFAEALAKHEKDLTREEEILRAVAIRTDLRNKTRSAETDRRAAFARTVLDRVALTHSACTLLPHLEQQLNSANTACRTLKDDQRRYSDTKALEQAAEQAEKQARLLHKALLKAGIEEAKAVEELKEAKRQLNELKASAAQHTGESSAVVADRLNDLTEARADTDARRRIAKQDEKHCEEQLREAERGQAGFAGRILAVLRAAGIRAQGLHDRIELDDRQRDIWEAALHPWREAVCVPGPVLAAALAALTDTPGAVLISSPQTVTTREGDPTSLPPGIRSAPDAAHGFLQALAEQSTWTPQPPHATMTGLGVHITGAFPTPVVGREALSAHWHARKETARNSVQAHQDQLRKLDTRIALAHKQLEFAQAAEALPAADHQHTEATGKLAALRLTLPVQQTQSEQANTAWTDAKAALSSRTDRLGQLNREITRAEQLITDLTARRTALTTAASEEPLTEAATAFGGDQDAARTLLGWPADWLPEDPGELLETAPPPPASTLDGSPTERRTADQLRADATSTTDACRSLLQLEARTQGYPTDALARAAQMDSADPETRTTATLRALTDWLAHNEATDASAQTEVENVRRKRQGEHHFITTRIDTLTEDLRNTQTVIIQRVESALDNITTALDRLDHKAGGFGADLLHQIAPPSDDNHGWRCSVTPRWRRNPGGPLLPYNTATNTAQEKLFSINLVLAALLAAPHAQGRVLILDELGDSLGQEHRREVLAAISTVAAEHGITVLGTCQDTIMKDVAGVWGEILYFHYPSKSEYLNLPTRMFGYDGDARRVELTAEKLLRPDETTSEH
ncbi:hypothetical protein [Kitasatospora sp. NPDC002965]|uniref:hypothetical protein n=1 Tax=Kitasatospora sp. NPDC002965 TaxID=3154775 RepID=UPI0033AEE688